MFRKFFFLFLTLIVLKSFATSLGAAVSWVPFNDRKDFVHDVELVEQILTSPKGGGGKSFFKIPRQRYFPLSANAALYKYQNPLGPTFEKFLEAAVQSLVQQISGGADSSDPFLSVVISSHGGGGVLATQHHGHINLDQVTGLIFQAGADFFQQTKKKLRIEILYSACYSGSLQEVIQRQLKARSNVLGPVTALTSTTDHKTSYASFADGDFLLKWITQLSPQLEKFREFKSFGAVGPTLAQLGFFKHFGGGHYNHPQFFSSTFSWSDKDTLDFLTKSPVHFIETAGERRVDDYFHRELNLDLFKLVDQTTTMSEAMTVIGFETWNDALWKNPDRVEKYLKHPKKFIRFAAALRFFGAIGKFHIFDKALERHRELGESVLVEWIRDPDFLSTIGDHPDPESFLMNNLERIPKNRIGEYEVVQILQAIYENFDSILVGRIMTDFARDFLLKKYAVRVPTDPFAPDAADKVMLPRGLSKEFQILLLRAFHVVPRDVSDNELSSHLLAPASGIGGQPVHPRFRIRLLKADMSCERVIGAKLSKLQLDAWSREVISRYDRGEFTDSSRNGIKLFQW